jgi:flagellar assembly protein FliH
MTEKSTPNRIPAEEAENAKPWILPPVKDARVLSSAEKEAKEKRDALLKNSKESISTIEVSAAPKKAGMTAEEMQAIFDAAEKDGFAQGHKEGYASGNAEGYEAGRQQGLMEMRAQLVAEQQRFQKVAQALLHPMAEQDDDLEQLLLDVICTLTQSVVQRELLTDSSQILDLVRQAVDALPVGSKHIRISLNPDDLASVEAYAAEQQLDWKFFSDTGLQPGGCRIDTQESRVDFSVSSRLQTVLEQFVTGQLANSDDEDVMQNDDDAQPESLL